MKTLQTLTAALLLILSTSAFANDETKANYKFEMNYALQTYIDAIAHGKVSGISEVLDNDVKFTTTRSEKIIHHSKAQTLKSLKENKNVEQNCVTEYNLLETNSSQAIVKVTMKYESFSKVNVVTLTNTTRGWKITNVSSSFLN